MITIFKKYRHSKLFKNKNALDLIPVRLVAHDVQENGNLKLEVKRFKFNFMNKLFHKSSHFYIKLDAQGSEVWKLIDGKRSVQEIADKLTSNKENLHERVVLFITDLYRKDLVDIKK